MLVRVDRGYTHPGRQQGHSLWTFPAVLSGSGPLLCLSMLPAVAFNQPAGGCAGKAVKGHLWAGVHMTISTCLTAQLPSPWLWVSLDVDLFPLGVATAYLL